jgi:hypothetical protein
MIERRRREDLRNIARTEMEMRLKGIVTAYAQLFPVPLKSINIHLEDGIKVEYISQEVKL